jgi:hypothetical protein
MSQRPEPMMEGRDYYCGTCAGHERVYCPECVAGCEGCEGAGTVPCPQCKGGEIPVPPPRMR